MHYCLGAVTNSGPPTTQGTSCFSSTTLLRECEIPPPRRRNIMASGIPPCMALSPSLNRGRGHHHNVNGNGEATDSEDMRYFFIQAVSPKYLQAENKTSPRPLTLRRAPPQPEPKSIVSKNSSARIGYQESQKQRHSPSRWPAGLTCRLYLTRESPVDPTQSVRYL